MRLPSWSRLALITFRPFTAIVRGTPAPTGKTEGAVLERSSGRMSTAFPSGARSRGRPGPNLEGASEEYSALRLGILDHQRLHSGRRHLRGLLRSMRWVS